MSTTTDFATLIAQQRASWQKSDDARDDGLPEQLSSVERLTRLAYGPEPFWQELELDLPKDGHQPFPVIVNVHGGGWIYGTIQTYLFYCLHLAENGFAVVNFNYRLAPQVQFPGELDDVDRVMHWLVAHASDYHLDLDHVFLVGDSAGGQMVEQYLAVLTNPDYRQFFAYQKPELTVRAAALNCSACFMLMPQMITGTTKAYFTSKVLKTHRESLDTETYLTPELPPLFLLTANQDFLRNQLFRLDGYLTAKKIRHRLAYFGTEADPRGHVFHIDQKDPLAKQANQEELDFFKTYLNN